MTPTSPIAEDIRDIRGPIAEAVATPWWPYLVAGLAVLATAAVIVLYVRRRRRALPADQRALGELAASRALIERGSPHELSVRVSNAVRGYVEEVFDIHAPRRTTEELLADLLRATSPVAPYRAELGKFLELCDLAKYARWSLSRGEMTTIVDHAESFVRATATPDAGVS